MKKALRLLLAAGVFLVTSCSGNSPEKVVLAGEVDSLSYSSGVYISQDIREMAREDMGIDSAAMGEFIAGLRAAFPLEITPESKAYAYGLSLGASAMEMYEKIKANLAAKGAGDIDAALFLEGMVATICGTKGPIDAKTATELYNNKLFREESDEFMRRNGRRNGVVTLPEGLQYKVEKMGTGAVAGETDAVSCIYKGYFTDGRLFDTSGDEALEIPVGEVIPGFARALQLFPEGTVCTIYIPWQLGYGPRGIDGIPPYSVLVFDLEIVKVIRK